MGAVSFSRRPRAISVFVSLCPLFTRRDPADRLAYRRSTSRREADLNLLQDRSWRQVRRRQSYRPVAVTTARLAGFRLVLQISRTRPTPFRGAIADRRGRRRRSPSLRRPSVRVRRSPRVVERIAIQDVSFFAVSTMKSSAGSSRSLPVLGRVLINPECAGLGDVRITFGSRHPGSPSARLLCADFVAEIGIQLGRDG